MFIKIPNYGEIITSSVVTKIYKKNHDSISANEIIMEVETEKATLEIRSFCDGIVSNILVKNGDKVFAGQDVIEINTDILYDNVIENETEKVKLSKLRQIISQRLKHVQNTAAIVTTFNEIDMTNVLMQKQTYQANAVKIGLTAFFIKAVANVLPNFPIINTQIENDYILYKKYYNIGFAIDIDGGLFVSVIKNANEMNLRQISEQVNILNTKAKNNELKAEDTQDGTFTITNGGVYGSLFSTPIINSPQSGILGINNIIKRPVVIDDKVVIRDMMYLSLSYDHRIIDGKDAIQFLIAVKKYIEEEKYD